MDDRKANVALGAETTDGRDFHLGEKEEIRRRKIGRIYLHGFWSQD